MTKTNDNKPLRITKDQIFSKVFKDREMFIMFLKDFINESWTEEIKPENIELLPTKFIDLAQGNKESDIIYSVKIEEKELLIFVLVEHQSKVNFLMPFRILEYMVKIWRSYIDKMDSSNQKSVSLRKGFKLPPIYPIVFYNGINQWTASMNFSSKVSNNRKFEKYIPNFDYQIVNLKEIAFEVLEELGDEISLILTFDKIKRLEDFEKAKKMKSEVWEKITSKIKGSGKMELLQEVIRIFLESLNVEEEEIDEILDKLEEGRLAEMFEMAVKYDVRETRRKAREEGHKEGREEGRKEGLKEGLKKGTEEGLKKTAKKMLEKGIDISDIKEITGLSENEIKEIQEKK
jgi:predicted transposase/invertase (TIGR01784 family)